jgi:hypothetical protein
MQFCCWWWTHNEQRIMSDTELFDPPASFVHANGCMPAAVW